MFRNKCILYRNIYIYIYTYILYIQHIYCRGPYVSGGIVICYIWRGQWPNPQKYTVLNENFVFHLHNFNLYIYIVSHNSSREHRAFTKFRHLTRFLMSTLASFHVLSWCLITLRIVVHHVVWGLPRGLVPWGFHSRAAFTMSPGGRRSVWPSHPHFLCWISNSIGLCLALAHNSWFDIWVGQNIFSILQMHLLTRTWSWYMMVLVSFQVSQP